MHDLISRQAAIDAVQHAFDRETLLNSFVRKVAVDALKTMPSAQPTVDAIPIEWIQKKIQIIEETGDFYSSAVLVEMIEGWRTEE